jgi:hypothetical protein
MAYGKNWVQLTIPLTLEQHNRIREESLKDGRSMANYVRKLLFGIDTRKINKYSEKEHLARLWNGAMSRCTNPKNRDYKNYGGRGITICDDFKNQENFSSYISKHLGKCPNGYTLDRIDNNKGYFPGNLRWATRKEQISNQRKTRSL